MEIKSKHGVPSIGTEKNWVPKTINKIVEEEYNEHKVRTD